MTEILGAVLKKDRVRMAQAPAPAPGPTAQGQYAPLPSGASAHVPRARIVRETASEVLIEVACSCGRQTLVRCQYPAAPDGATENRPQTPVQGEGSCVA
jgi:hypothetical protein